MRPVSRPAADAQRPVEPSPYGRAVRELDWGTSKAIQLLRVGVCVLALPVLAALAFVLPSDRAELVWTVPIVGVYLLVHLAVTRSVRRRPPRLLLTVALAALDCLALTGIFAGHWWTARPPAGAVQQYYEPVAFLAAACAAHSLHYSWRPGVAAAITAIGGYLFLAVVRGYPWNFVVFGVLVLALSGTIAALGARSLRRLLSRAVDEALVRQRLGRYLPVQVADRIARDRREPGLGGERAMITVLVIDLRGSTALSSSLGAEGFVALLNELYARAVREVFAEEGTLDKFLGDGLLVFFGAPTPQPDHAARATRCALRLQSSIEEWNKQRAALHEPPIEAGCGLHTGEAIVGTVGTTERLEYTALGETVNLASRVEGMCRALEAPVIASDATVGALPEGAFEVSPLGAHELRGHEHQMALFRVVARDVQG